ncbi:MAG: addiction module toxin [uncultured bacterium]|nr:MAG: addiction module toxin [uncultured bacterium]OFW68813.1 MAG: hypothetical protein A2X70_00775 [Alphaproteobacteria bacterium GWC2_42_16]OFW73383.1 MAG: hypothetical protein A2Z80_02490 [Alphaproteobacteria bacterium GWA2_41_27]OFW81838.1 MAG: hypothetical protein A3E50_05045 [Alphaproteobacteria bacterium RIFCSPHIGHO2_12_FULL_42_100]OFW85849.1 MAG: hypothetical protein A2W06_01865 [Alphaproteobacteria bacterium RBG_16_42_14]OFW90901.1 MAG: hypothetical protein A3C41_07250 [Alphaproteob
MYQVILEEPVQRQIRKLDPFVQKRLFRALVKLEKNPRAAGTKKLRGINDLYRLRVGDFRVLYQIEDDKLFVLVVALGHRRDIYRF